MDEHFVFDNYDSKELGIKIIKTSSGFSSTPYGLERNVSSNMFKESFISYNETMENKPLTFTVEFGVLNEGNKWRQFEPNEKRELASYLIKDYYVPFYTMDDPGRIMYVKAIRNQGLVQGGDGSARFEIEFRANAPCFWTPLVKDIYTIGDPSDIGGNSIDIPNDGDYQYEKFRELKKRLAETETQSTFNKEITITNFSNVGEIYKPLIYVKGLSDTDFEIINYSNGGKRTYINGIKQGEIVAMDSQNNQIISDMPMRTPSRHFNYEWLELVQGENYLKFTGNVEILYVAQYPIV